MRNLRQRHSTKATPQQSLFRSLPIVLLSALLVFGILTNGALEICRHNGGEAHLFISGFSCDGLHATHGEHHDHADKQPVNTHNCGNHHHDGHHEPCDHESLSIVKDWSYSVSRPALPIPEHIGIQTFLDSVASAALKFDAIKFAISCSRAPPVSTGARIHYLSTIRLLI